jgi:hypothetical protein
MYLAKEKSRLLHGEVTTCHDDIAAAENKAESMRLELRQNKKTSAGSQKTVVFEIGAA